MKMAVRQWLRKARESLPEPQVLLVPGHFFYTHRFEVSAEMSREETEAFLALALEGSAPFPLEHLSWGYFHRAGESHALVFATSRQRLRTLGDLDWEGFFHAFPGFVTLFGKTSGRAKVRFVSQNGALTALYFPADKAVPDRVVSREIVAEVLTDGAILSAREKLAREVSTAGYDVEEGVWVGDGYEINQKGQPVFRHRRIGAGSSQEADHALDFDPTTMWGLDLRDGAYAAVHRKERRLAHQLWMGVKGVAAALILCALLGALNFGLQRATEWTDQTLLARYNRADRISEDKRFIERLSTDSAQSLNPVQMLTLVNTVRPKEVFFRSASALREDEGDGIVLSFEGECRADAGVVNTYAENIRAVDAVRTVVESTEIRDGRTYFEMDVTFDPTRLAAVALREEAVARVTPPDNDESEED